MLDTPKLCPFYQDLHSHELGAPDFVSPYGECWAFRMSRSNPEGITKCCMQAAGRLLKAKMSKERIIIDGFGTFSDVDDLRHIGIQYALDEAPEKPK